MSQGMSTSTERDIPLEERLRQKKNGFAVNYMEEQHDSDSSDSDKEDGDEEQQLDTQQLGKKKRRANKNCPLELTSKRAVGRFRNVVDIKKRKVVDPRFDSMSGKLNEDLFAKSYAFLDEYKRKELEALKHDIRKVRNAAQKEELQREINVRSQELAEKKKSDKIKSALADRKRAEREAVERGKSAFYLKRKDKKKIELETKFKDLQESGRLSKFMAKKRKKNASKDHRWLPTQRKD